MMVAAVADHPVPPHPRVEHPLGQQQKVTLIFRSENCKNLNSPKCWIVNLNFAMRLFLGHCPDPFPHLFRVTIRWVSNDVQLSVFPFTTQHFTDAILQAEVARQAPK